MAQRARWTRRVWHRFALGLLLTAVVLVLSIPTSSSAQSRSVVVERRDGVVTIQQNGDVEFVETWQVRFEGGPFRRAFREIPLAQTTGITGWQVTEEGQPLSAGRTGAEAPGTFEVVGSSESQRITWYLFTPASNETRTFTLRYVVQGSLRIYPDGDQFWWKFIEADRQYPILASQVQVNLPASFSNDQLLAQAYVNNQPIKQQEILNGSTVQFTGGPFAPGDEWELRVQFPHGVVLAPPPPWQAWIDAVPLITLGALVLAGVLLLGGGGGMYLLWDFFLKEPRVAAVPVTFDSPPHMPPGIAGLLIDESADLRDIVATLMDLARRGILRMEQIGEFKSNYRFVLQNTNAPLLPYEKVLLDRMFGSGGNSIELATLKNSFYIELSSIKNAIYDYSVQQGYFSRNRQQHLHQYMRMGKILHRMAFTIGIVILSSQSLLPDPQPALPALLAIPAVLFLIGLIPNLMKNFVSMRTPKGAQATAVAKAFKRYLEQIQQYLNTPAAKARFDQYLPYAIAFGIEKQLVQQFSHVDAPAPSWYVPHHGPVIAHQDDDSSPFSVDTPPRGIIFADGDGNLPTIGMGGGNGGIGMPSLDSMAGDIVGGLNDMSSGLMDLLNETASTFVSVPSPPPSSSSSWGSSSSRSNRDDDDDDDDDRSSSGGGGGWSGGGDSGGDGGGGGSSDFD